MKNILVIAFIILLTASIAQASEDKPLTKVRKFGLSWNIWGPTVFTSLSANYFAISHLKIEAGAGLVGYFGGSTFHFYGSGRDGASPYVGAYISRIGNWAYPVQYFPIGVCFGGARKKGRTISIELAYFRNRNANNATDENLIGGSIKLGYYF